MYTILIENFIPELPQYIRRTYSNEQDFNILFLGRLSPEKGIETFLELPKTLSDCQFHIYGMGQMENLVKAAQLNLPNLHFHGFCQNVNRVIEQSHLLIIPSTREGLPLVALEAVSAGLPVLASRVGGLPKLLKHQRYLTDPRDKNEIIEKIQSIKDIYSEVVIDFEQLSQETRKDYSLPGWIEKTKKIYKSF